MEGVIVCDRDEVVIKGDDKGFKITVTIENGANKFSKTIDACESCTGFIARNIAQRLFLDDPLEAAILKEIGCSPSKKSVKKSKIADKPTKPATDVK